MKFLGIDFGWMSGASGLCCLKWQDGTLQLLDLRRYSTIEDILAWVDAWAPAPEPAMIAVDAPTLIPNATGMRLPDKLAHKYFGRYHAGCYPANLSSRFAQRTTELGLSLEARDFLHAPILENQSRERYQIEVFPHPAIVNLFQLNRILKYKKGRLSERRLELAKLQQYILKGLPALEPKLDRLTLENIKSNQESDIFCDLNTLAGSHLKAVEDQLDALICAYVAVHWWYWGLERNLVLGDCSTGYIVIPSRSERYL
ncbi:MAG: DUF429 domain-containing protein [Microcoleus vaginatus WJT46-NPBG5]|jgi:predicted RNase H-like nuclease|nr:DUF429 domain-containing protein [Microcoleus vaginatus WJT46-NPBG5]